MPLTVSCSACQKVYSLPDTMRGKKVRCKECQAMFTAEEAGAPAAAPAPQVETVASTCPSCQSVYQLAATMTGKQVRCKKCQGTFVAGQVPAVTEEVVEEATVEDETEAMMAKRRERVRAQREGGDSAAPTIRRPAGESTAVRKGSAPAVSEEEEVYEVEEEDEDSPRRQRVLVQIASDLDGSPRPKRFPVAVLSVLGGMALMTLVVLALLVGGGIVLANKASAMKERSDAAVAARDAAQKAATAAAAVPKNLDEAIRNTKDNDAIKRKGGLDFLQKSPMDASRKKEVGEALNDVLRSKDDNHRMTAFKVLDKWEIPETDAIVGAACEATKSPSKEVRIAAMSYVCRFDQKRCFDALSERLKVDDDRDLAVNCFFVAAEKGAVPKMKIEASVWPRLKESAATIKGACKVLGAVGGQQSRKQLEAAKKDAPQEAMEAINEAIVQIDARKQK